MSDYIVNNFLPEDHEQAEEQLECYFHNIHLARWSYKKGLIDKVFIHHENASRSLRDLQKLKDKHDKAWFINKQNESDRVMAEQLVNVYAKQSN